MMSMWETLIKWKKLNEKEYVITMLKLLIMIGIPFAVLGFFWGFIIGRL